MASTLSPIETAFVERARASAERVRGTEPDALSLLPPHASPRRYARATFAACTEIAMLLPPADAAPTEIGGAGAASVEGDPFVETQRWLHRAKIPVPELYAIDEEDRTIWLEDLGDRDLDQWLNERPGLYRERYPAAIELLADFTANAARTEVPAAVHARRFDASLLRWELDHYAEWRLQTALGVTPSADQQARLDHCFDALVQSLLEIPEAIIHRDFQSHNIMVVGAEPRLVLLDFQDAMRGPLVYDAVALLRDSYVELERDELRDLVRAWADALRARGVVSDAQYASLPRWFALQTVQRKLKDAGRFVFIDRVRHNPGFLRFIPSSLRYVAQALAELPELHELREVLCELDPDLAQLLQAEPPA